MINLKNKKLLILGGDALSCELVKAAKSLGVFTMVTDWYPLSKSPAKQIADKYFMVSSADIEAVLELIKEEHVDGVITGFTDSVLPYYQKICEKANIPCYLTSSQVQATTNKHKFKELCHKFSIPVVEEYKLNGSLSATDLNKIQYPVILKPADNSGGRGINICKNTEEFIKGYQHALSFSKTKSVLAEKYMTGSEVTIFYTLNNGDIILSAMGDRHIKHNQTGVIPLPVAYTFPSKYLQKYQETIDEKVRKMFESLGMQNGIVFIQSFVENGSLIIYEMGYRLTGSLEYKLIEKINGYNPLNMMINFALTGKMGSEKTLANADPNFKYWACNITFLAKPGKIKTIIGLEKIKKMPDVLDIVISYKVGDTIPEKVKGTLSQVVFRVFAIAESKSELAQKMEKIQKSVKVISSEGQNMLLQMFNVNDLYYE